MGVYDGLMVPLERGNNHLVLYDWFLGTLRPPLEWQGLYQGQHLQLGRISLLSSLEGEQNSFSIQLGLKSQVLGVPEPGIQVSYPNLSRLFCCRMKTQE
jgi:hypothetical protein